MQVQSGNTVPTQNQKQKGKGPGVEKG